MYSLHHLILTGAVCLVIGSALGMLVSAMMIVASDDKHRDGP